MSVPSPLSLTFTVTDLTNGATVSVKCELSDRMKDVLRAGGLQRRLAALLSPLLGRIYPTAARDPETMESLCGNATANLLGLGNAATPLGIAAVRRMQALSGGRAATDEACRLIVMNTASIQLLPTTVAALRAGLGSASPFAILPAVWATSLLSVSAGLLAARVLQKWL